MGGPWEILTYGPPDICRDAIEAAFAEIGRVESLLTVFRPDSEISRINRAPKPGQLTVDPEVCRVVGQALRYARLTEGAFDPTVGAIDRLWGFGPDGPRSVPPDPKEARAALQGVGYRHVHIEEGSSMLTFLEPGIELDLGGIGKGYAVDKAVESLTGHGIRQGWVSCGSTRYALGTPPDSEAWQIGIRHPLDPERIIQTIGIRDQAISTSGNYEQFFMFGGRRYGHIYDPRKGCPAAGPAGVSVISRTATEADVLSTAAFVLGDRAGLGFLEARKDVQGSFITECGGEIKIVGTNGWARSRWAGLNRRQFLTGLVAAMGLLILRPPLTAGKIYLTVEEALRKVMPGTEEFIKEIITLTPEQEEEVARLLKKKIKNRSYTFYRGVGSDSRTTTGYGVVLDVIGKERPITFLIGVNPEARVMGLEVLIYRESQGYEIRSKRFRKQFIGKTVKAPLRLGRDIHGMSGATLSSRSTAYAVKKALALTKVVYGVGKGSGG